MNRDVSNRTIAIVALVISVAGVVFCGRLASDFATAAKGYEREILSLKTHRNELQHLMLNIRTLLFLNPEAFHRNRDRARKPIDLPIREHDVNPSQMLEKAERKQARKLFDTYLEHHGDTNRIR